MSEPPAASAAPRVLVTREHPEPVVEAVRAAGGEPIALPLLETVAVPAALPEGATLDDYDWIAFTSARAVTALHTAAQQQGWRWPPEARCAAVGAATARALADAGVEPALTAHDAGAAALAATLQLHGADRGTRVLYPCSAIAGPDLARALRAAGARVDVVPVYTTRSVWQAVPARRDELGHALRRALQVGAVPTCASPSAVHALVELAGAACVHEALAAVPVVVLGPTTARAAVAAGLHPIEAEGRSFEHLARKAVEVARSR